MGIAKPTVLTCGREFYSNKKIPENLRNHGASRLHHTGGLIGFEYPASPSWFRVEAISRTFDSSPARRINGCIHASSESLRSPALAMRQYLSWTRVGRTALADVLW